MEDRFKVRAWDKSLSRMDNWNDIKRGSLLTYLDNPNFTLMQCLAIEDVNDKLFFEDDIVKGYDGIAVIKYNNHYEAGGLFYPDFTDFSPEHSYEIWREKLRWYKLEIIGNIHQHAHLLKEGN